MGHYGIRGPTLGISSRGNHFYAFPERPETEAFDTIITGVVSVYHRPASILFDLGSTYSYVSTYFSVVFDLLYAHMLMPVHVSTQ